MEAKLSEIPIGTKSTIVEILDCPFKVKLKELGLKKGTELEVAFKGPLGDPIAISYGESMLSIRLDEAQFIVVEAQKL